MKSDHSVFYIHMYKDGQVAKFGLDTYKEFQMDKYSLLWSKEVRHSPASLVQIFPPL